MACDLWVVPIQIVAVGRLPAASFIGRGFLSRLALSRLLCHNQTLFINQVLQHFGKIALIRYAMVCIIMFWVGIVCVCFFVVFFTIIHKPNS